jgi:hypothetical protein
MGRIYEFAIARLSSADSRDERLNVGLIVLKNDMLDVRPARRLDKVRAMSAALDGDQTREFLNSFAELDRHYAKAGIGDIKQRLSMMTVGLPLTLSEFGTFAADSNEQYEARITSLLRALVDPEPGHVRVREKRSRLLTEVKAAFRSHKVLAQKGETIESHRLVTKYEIAEGLTADLALKNGVMHVVETVDASGDEESLRTVISQIGVAALVLESAEIKYGPTTKKRLLYTASPSMERIAKASLEAACHNGATLTNWASASDRIQFVDGLSSLASPILSKRPKSNFASFGELRRLV